jgi:hypothetical protein
MRPKSHGCSKRRTGPTCEACVQTPIGRPKTAAPVHDFVRASIPFIVAMLVFLLFLAAVPDSVLLLPNLLM